MADCFFVSDLHGSQNRCGKLFAIIEEEVPAAVFVGGDLFPSGLGGMLGAGDYNDFLDDVFAAGFRRLQSKLQSHYPSVFIILGNDDAKKEEERINKYESLWTYVHNRHILWKDFSLYGYACVPPTPFVLKDWERYDVSTYLDPLCVAPEDGWLSIPVPKSVLKHRMIHDELQQLVGDDDLSRAIFLFHTPPYNTALDRAALDGKKVDHVHLDVHIGSIAVRRFIESKQPMLTLHGHVHESARITGMWKEKIGRTVIISAAHDAPELALVRFDTDDVENATRELI